MVAGNKSIATRLRSGRVAAGLSQPQVAGALGKSTAWLCKIEKGQLPASSEHVAAIEQVIYELSKQRCVRSLRALAEV
jgi:transcriptional regulator with XRE-family HTH domain